LILHPRYFVFFVSFVVQSLALSLFLGFFLRVLRVQSVDLGERSTQLR